MANHSVKTVFTTPVLLSPNPTHSGVDLIIQNNSEDNLFLGSDSVTEEAYGFKLVPEAAISLRLSGREELYGCTDGASAISINVLTVGLA
jgi:hypothetical protein